MTILINDLPYESEAGERLVDVLNRAGVKLPQVCYLPQLGPIQTCDTCLVEVMAGSCAHVEPPSHPTWLRGQKIIVSDLREHEMARRADLFLPSRPGTDLVWLSGISKYLLDNGLADSFFLTQWVNGLDDYRKSLEPFTLEFVSRTCELPIQTLKEAAHMIAEAKAACALWAMGVTQHSNGSDTSTAISNLLLVTGNYMRPGTGAYPLRGHNNVQGKSDHGAMPDLLPGYQSVHDPEAAAIYVSVRS